MTICCNSHRKLRKKHFYTFVHFQEVIFESFMPQTELWPHSPKLMCWTLTPVWLCVCVCVCVCVCGCDQLCNSMDHSLPGSSVHGVLQARILERGAIPFFRSESFKFQMKLELKSDWLPDPIFCPLCPASDFWDREQLKGFGKMCSLYPLLRLPVYNFYLLTCHNEVSKGMNALQEYSFLFSLQSRKELA